MTIWEAIIQGIVQGLTEFLPVSSSGHVSIVQHFLNKNIEGAQAFTLFLHFGTLVAVFVVYYKLIWDLIREFFRMAGDLFSDQWALITKGKGKFRPRFSWKLASMSETRRMVIFLIVACMCAILLFLPVLGMFGLYDRSGELVKTISDLSAYTSEDKDIMLEGFMLLLTGGLLLYATKIARQRGTRGSAMTMKSALAMGVGQCFAAMPGLSRSGTTTTLGMITGTEKNKALEFSFILGVPTILAANVLEIATMTDAERAEFELLPVIFGMSFAAIFGVIAIAGLRWIVGNDKLHYFGYYCLAAGLVVIIIAIVETATGCGGANAGELLAEVSGGDVTTPTDVVASMADVIG